ncbi:MAG TPA: hypothetical protein VKT49_08230 [Bryobacteraceae bacterium]|nr:hypothetical protein [Bryobacteraceae bacterium]
MQKRFRTLIGIGALSVFGVVAIQATAPAAYAQAPAAAQKKPKDNAEYDIFNNVIKDIQANNSAKAVTDLDTWTQKYPDSDYKDDRLYYYMQAYSKANPPQPAKVVEYGMQLVNKGLKTTFTDPQQGPTVILNVLYLLTATIPTLPNPTPDQMALGEKSAHDLLDYLPTFFANDKKPAGTTDQAWTQARTQLETAAKKSLIAISLIPGNQAMAKKPPDCPAAEEAFKKGLMVYPDSSMHAYQLALALRCQQKENPDKIPQAVYEFERAAVIDPTLGGGADPKKIQDFADQAYATVHGSNEGLDQLKQQVKGTPLPPAGFTIKTATQIAQEKENQFEQSNPQLALWMKIKGQLADTAGEQYFEDQLKNSAVPQLRGTLVEAKPECRPKELLVAVPLPDAQQPLRAEITLKLDSALTGKPDLNKEFHWEGVPSAFTKDPFMLTMDTEKAKVEGLSMTPCAATPARRGGARRAAARKQ